MTLLGALIVLLHLHLPRDNLDFLHIWRDREWWWQLELQYKQSSSQIVTINKPTPDFLQTGCPSYRPTNSVL